MDSIQNSAVTPNDDRNPIFTKNLNKTKKSHKKNRKLKSILNDEFLLPYQKYTMEANYLNSNNEDADVWHEKSHERVRRATSGSRPKEENKNTCSLYIQTDPLIWRHIREGIADVCNLLK